MSHKKAPKSLFRNDAKSIVEMMRWRLEKAGTPELPAADLDLALVAWMAESIDMTAADEQALLDAAGMRWGRTKFGSPILLRKVPA